MQYPDYPFESRWFDRDGLRMHYIDEGPVEGEGDARSPGAVVMVHGNPTWSYYFRRLVTALRDRHRCVAPDHIGMGQSDKPGDGQYAYTLASRVSDLDQLLAHAGVERDITLVVHDWGGMIALAWAVRHPDRIARLVILNTAAFALPSGQRFPWQLSLCRGPLGALLVRGCNLFCRRAAKHCVTRRPLPAGVRRAYLAPYDSWASRIAVHRFVHDIPLRDGDASWDQVQQTAAKLEVFADRPILICWGMRDFVFTPAFLAEWERRLPAAQVRRFNDAGHFVLEDAAEEIVPAVRAFVDST